MSSSDLSLHTISFQDTLRSKPIRENFTDIQNEHNLLRHEFYASVASTATEITNARDFYPSLVERERGVAKGNFNSWVDGLAVGPDTEDWCVTVDPGEAIVNGVGCYNENGIDPLILNEGMPAGRSVAAIVINSDNSISCVNGGNKYKGEYPTIAQTQKLLAYVQLDDAIPAMTAGMIEDRRQDRQITVSKLKYAGYHNILRSPAAAYAPVKEFYLNWDIDDLHHVNATYNTGGSLEKVRVRGVEPGVKSMIVKHPRKGSTDLCFLSATLHFWHINHTGYTTSGTTMKYHLATGGTAGTHEKHTVFQLFTHDSVNVFVAQNPFHKVTI
jgi:hypothetical protein